MRLNTIRTFIIVLLVPGTLLGLGCDSIPTRNGSSRLFPPNPGSGSAGSATSRAPDYSDPGGPLTGTFSASPIPAPASIAKTYQQDVASPANAPASAAQAETSSPFSQPTLWDSASTSFDKQDPLVSFPDLPTTTAGTPGPIMAAQSAATFSPYTTFAPAGIVRGGQSAPALQATTLDGQSFSLSQYLGKVVVLDFWKTTCGPCLRAIPKVSALRSAYPEAQVAIIGINCDESISALQAYSRRQPHPWPQIHSGSQRANPLSLYGVSLLPTFVVIDQTGRIQYKGNDVSSASSKTAELVSNPSISPGPGGGSVIAYVR
jgi:thiol-disulfide isomerase/thioredoxin